MENKNLVSEAFKVIRKHEGFKAEPYLDSKNNWTIGIGTLIGKGKEADLKASPYYGKKINEATAQKIAIADINKKIDLVKQLVGPDKFSTFSPQLQAQIVSGAYRGDITGSPKTLSLLREGKFKEASKEFLNNEEYRTAKASKSGVAGRMEEVSSIMSAEKPIGFAEAVERRLDPPKPEIVVPRTYDETGVPSYISKANRELRQESANRANRVNEIEWMREVAKRRGIIMNPKPQPLK